MLFYAASAFAWQQQDPEALQKQTFAALKPYMSEQGYKEVTQSSKPSNAYYRSTVFNEVDSFRQQLPYYQPRVLYSSLLFGLYKLGFNIVLAMKLVSVVVVVSGLLVLLSVFRGQQVSAPLFYLSPWLISALGYFDLARFYGPDGVAFLLVALCYRYLLNVPAKVMWFLPLLVLVRTDLIFFVGISSLYLYKSGQKPWHIGVVLFVSAMLLKFLQYVFGGYSWGVTVYFTFVDLNPYPETLNPGFTLASYVELLIEEIKQTVLTDDRFLAFLLLAIYPVGMGIKALFQPFSVMQRLDKIALLGLLGVAYIALHIALFPASWERFFMAQYVLVFMLMLVKSTQLFGRAVAKFNGQPYQTTKP